MSSPGPFSEFTKLIERSASAGRGVQISAEVSRAVLAHPAYQAYLAARTSEIVAMWEPAGSAENDVERQEHSTGPAANARMRARQMFG